MKYFVLFGDREDELNNIEFTDITKATTWVNEHFDDFSIIRVIQAARSGERFQLVKRRVK